MVPLKGAGLPNTGALLKLKENGTFSFIIDSLNQPTSMEFIGNNAYIVSLAGEIWKIGNTKKAASKLFFDSPLLITTIIFTC
ncbi:MAG TPA: hypothetical protein VM187_16040 [Niastella sp.]|nr:hypothetical protein [Niastella sp.]